MTGLESGDGAGGQAGAGDSRPFLSRKPGILAYMPVEQSPAVPGPDEFDRQLRDLTSGASGAASFREPSAQERAAHPARSGQPGKMSWRSARKARKLRKPLSPPARPGSRLTGRSHLRVVGGAAMPRRAPVGPRRQRLRSAAKTIGILVGFAALIVVLHLLGLGPQ